MLTIAACQMDFPVGAAAANAVKVIDTARQQLEDGADLVVFPEMTLAGYPPEDLVLRQGFISACQKALQAILDARLKGNILVGLPLSESGELYNALVWIRDGKVIGIKRKEALPNYAVFDEKRYFASTKDPLVIECNGVRCGVLVCEDLWLPEPVERCAKAGAELLIVANASPFHEEKAERRQKIFSARAAEHGLPICYVNLIGGQDELVFDGASCVTDSHGQVVESLPEFSDECAQFVFDSGQFIVPSMTPRQPSLHALRYAALVRGTRDYIQKNGFADIVLGLSGGIDSALVLAIAVDAIGAEHCHAVMLPSRYTSQLSLDLARRQAEILGVDYQTIPIEPTFEAFTSVLAKPFAGLSQDLTEENLQSRARGTLLMALSNKLGWLVLTTGNKSEYAVGYATIYGDMCGGFAPIKDCSKSLVFDLCRWLNHDHERIVQGIIDRPPSAELREDQKDEDSLPPYDILDDIIARYVEHDEHRDQIAQAGHDPETIDRVIGMILRNEWKRRQSAPGVRITPRAFGRDRRYPITNGYR